MRLANKVAIVTGAGSGIGRAIALRFAHEGAAVVVAELEEGPGQETVAEITAAGGKAVFVHTDVSKAEDAHKAAATAKNSFGGLHILVNNAAAFVFASIDDTTPQHWQRALGVNVIGPAQFIQAVLPELRANGGGAIVNIASVSGFIAQPKFVPYNTSKAALMQMTRCLAFDLGPENIRVNAICPGEIHTRATDHHIKTAGMDPATALQKLASIAPLRRLGKPEEIASAALFLASDEASFVTGAMLVVDGGATLD